MRTAAKIPNRMERIAMQSKQKQMLAVWGSPGSGKTVTALKIAAELAKGKKNVAVVFCDAVAPPLPTVIRTKKSADGSLGAALSFPVISQEIAMKNLVASEQNPYVSFIGYAAGENAYTYAGYIKERAVDMLVLLRHIADHVIVDCSSVLNDNVLSTAALEVADNVLRLCPCDLKGLSYYMSYLPLIGDRKFKTDKHIRVLTNPHPYQGGREYENAYGGVSFCLPYLPSIEEQAVTQNLLAPLSGKEGKAYEGMISAITREVFDSDQ